MLASLLQFAASAAVIIVAGTFLTRFTDQIGHLTGLGRTLAGMVLLALATSLPEATIGGNAALIGAVDLTAGDLLGSSLMNLLILALLDLTHYSRGRMLSSTAAAHALGVAASIVMTALVLLFLLLRPRWALFGRVGIETVVLIGVYWFTLRLLYVQQRVAASSLDRPAEAQGEDVSYSLRGAILGYVAAAAAIFVAAPFLARAADRLAVESGLGGTFVGTTLVALSTSLPEAVTTFTAVRRGALDLAVGNVVGSNVFNMVIFAVVDLFQAGPLFAALAPTHAVTAAWVILVATVTLIAQLYRAERRYWLIEADAALVIGLITAAVVSVYLLE